MIAPRARGRLRGSLRPRLSWTRTGISSVRNHSLVGTKRIIAKFKLKFKVRGVIRIASTDFAGRSGLFVPP